MRCFILGATGKTGTQLLELALQNGRGNVEQLGPRAALGVTTMGATLLGPGHIRRGGAGPTQGAFLGDPRTYGLTVRARY